jgi:hypothetical protein
MKSTIIIINFLLAIYASSSVYAACGLIPGTYPFYSGSEIKLSQDITINGNNTPSGNTSANSTIAIDGSRGTVSQILPDLDPASFPSNTETADIKSNTSFSISSSTEIYYDELKLNKKDTSITFTGGGPFHIDKLEIKKENSVINFAAGTYYINTLKIKKDDSVINITSEPVIIHIGTEFNVQGEDVDINKSGNVDGLIVYLHSGAKFVSSKENLDLTGVIYGPNIDQVFFLKKNVSIHGAIIAGGGKIESKKQNLSLTYSVSDQTAVNAISTCSSVTENTAFTEDTASTDFNCVENGANGISGKLYTKTTAQSFSFDVIALQDSSTIETSFASAADHSVTVELVDASAGGSCSSYVALSPAVSQSLTFTSSDSGTKASVSMSSSKAYSNVRCRVTDATDSPFVIGCSSDNFSIRPTSFTLTSSQTNTATTGTPKAKAGENFTLTATATTGYTGTPAINNAKVEAHSGAVQTGSISGAFSTASSGSGAATGTSFTYSEVGSLRFLAEAIYDDSFTTVDQSSDCTNDFSNALESGKVGCKFGNSATSNYFGRFTPDHFDVSLNTPSFSPGCSTFTYVGQPVQYSTTPIATISAKNASNTITQNYTGSYWKINPTDLSYGITPSYSADSQTLSVVDSSEPSVVYNGDGTGTLTFSDTSSNILAVTKNSLSAPFDAEIALSFTLSDTDTIVVANVDGAAQVNPVIFGTASAGNGISFDSTNKEHRWGRFVLDNSHGSELTPLSVPSYIEYYNGTNFVTNTADNCSAFTLANDFSISDGADFNCTLATQTSPVSVASGSVKATMSISTVSSGVTELLISDNSDTSAGPGAGNTGYIEITSKLDNLSWLNYDWDADGTHDNCPSARASFGIYKGNSRQIYFREVY